MTRSVALVTGAGRGMGRACADRFTSTADVLVLVDRDAPSLDAAAGALAGSPCEVVAVTLDVTDREQIGALAARVAELGRLGPIAHAAGISPTMADWRAIFQVDLVGTALLADALTPLVTAGTAMVCFASSAAHLAAAAGDPPFDAVLDEPLHPELLARLRAAAGESIEDPGVAYGWAKRGVQRLARRVAVSWGPRGGRICSISPGLIDTPMGRQETAAHPVMTVLLEHTPLGREGTADELAAVVEYLCSPAASFVTGCDLLVDGGMCAAMEALGAAAV